MPGSVAMWCSSGAVTMFAALLGVLLAVAAAEPDPELLEQLNDPGIDPVHRHRLKRDTCGGQYTHQTENKVITSPNYPSDYHNSADCYYTIRVPPGHQIHVTFEDFRIEIPRVSASDCTYVGLMVRDGIEPMGRYCGMVKPPDFTSRSNFIIMNLYSDESLGFRGFKLRFRVLDPELLKQLNDSGIDPVHRHRVKRDTCGGQYTHQTENKVITSPNYPSDYHNSADCYYTIRVPPGHHIHVTFEDFRIEIPRTSSANCTYDGLVVRDGSRSIEPMGRYCGKVKPPDFTSRSNTIIMNLYSDESLGFRGFKLRFKVLCGNTFFSEHGTLYFNENVQHISETNTCEYELVTTADKYLDLNFTVNELMMTTVYIIDHGEVIRTLKKNNDYTDMDVRVISTSNVVRVRFVYSGLSEGHVIIAFQAQTRKIVSGDPVFLFHLQTCRGIASVDGVVTASDITKLAVAHRFEKVGGHQNDSLVPGDEVYMRTLSGGSRPLSLSASRAGLAEYDGTARDNSTWKLFGQLRHGGRVWLENKEMAGNYLGMFGAVTGASDAPTVQMKVALCAPAVDWVVYKVPLDFGWYRYRDRGEYQARWVDGLAPAARRDCLPHPLLFPHCGGTHDMECPGAS